MNIVSLIRQPEVCKPAAMANKSAAPRVICQQAKRGCDDTVFVCQVCIMLPSSQPCNTKLFVKSTWVLT